MQSGIHCHGLVQGLGWQTHIPRLCVLRSRLLGGCDETQFAGCCWQFLALFPLQRLRASLSALAEPPLTREQQAHTASTMVTVDVYGPSPMSLFRAAADKLPGVHNKEGQLVTDGFLDVCGLVVPVIGECFICSLLIRSLAMAALRRCTCIRRWAAHSSTNLCCPCWRCTCRAVWGCLWPGEERHQPEH